VIKDFGNTEFSGIQIRWHNSANPDWEDKEKRD